MLPLAAAPLIGLLLTSASAAQAEQATAASGAVVFKQNCAMCHQAAGQGVRGAFPALAGNTFVQGDPRAVALVLLNGRGGMPNFSEQLSPEQIASVLTFVRSSWGNHAAPVSVTTVTAARNNRAKHAPSGS
jgi:mono/diheme cytochrome c family protein